MISIRNLLKYSRICIAAVLIGFLIRYFIKNSEDLKVLQQFEPKIIVFMFLTYFFSLIVFSNQYYVIIRNQGIQGLNRVSHFKIFVISRFLTKFFPQAGNFYKAIVFKKKYGFSYSKSIISYSSFLILDLFINLILVFIIIFFFHPTLKIGNVYILRSIIFLILIILISIISLYLLLRKRSNHKIINKVQNIVLNIIDCLKDWRLFMKIFLFGVFAFFLVAVIYILIFSGLKQKPNLAAVVIFTILQKLLVLISITPGNIGTQEISFGYISEVLNIGFSTGILVAIVYRIVAYTSLTIFGMSFGSLQFLTQKRIVKEI